MSGALAAIDRLSVWAVRYALGRATYAVSDVVNTLIVHRKALSDRSAAVIIRDIDEAIAAGNVGMDMDRRQWERLRRALDRSPVGQFDVDVRPPGGVR